jgi:hypothetical protein
MQRNPGNAFPGESEAAPFRTAFTSRQCERSLKSILVLGSCATFLSAMPAFGQSASYFGKSDAPTEDVRTIKEPSIPGRSPQFRLPPQATAAQVETNTRLLIQDQFSARNETSALPVRVQPAQQETRRVGNKWATTYGVTIANIPLSEASNISSLTLEDGSATVVRERNIPIALNFDQAQGAQPTVTVEKAVSAAQYDLEQLARTNSSADIGGLVLRKSQLEIWVHPRERIGKLAWALDLSRESSATTPGAAYRIWVDALAATEPAGVFEVKTLILKEHRGLVTGPVWDPTPLDPFQLRPLSRAHVQSVSAGPVMSEAPAALANEVTDDNGSFDISGLEQNKFTITLQNQYFTVRNAQGGTATVSGIASMPAASLALQFGSSTEFEIAQPSAFYWANRVRAFAGDVLKDTDLLGVEVLVNSDPDCNATFNPLRNRLTLYRASLSGTGRNCINKAYRDTVFHEFGHAIDHACGGITNTEDGHAYSEGFGDSLAIMFKNDSCYGANQ